MEGLDEVIKEFLVESHENLDELDRSLVQLESNPNDRGRLAAIFRTVHTIKGTCGFLGLGKLERVTHVGENLLSKLRDGELTLRPEITTGLLSLVDAIRQMLGEIEASGTEGNRDYADLVETLIELQQLSAQVGKTPSVAEISIATVEVNTVVSDSSVAPANAQELAGSNLPPADDANLPRTAPPESANSESSENRREPDVLVAKQTNWGPDSSAKVGEAATGRSGTACDAQNVNSSVAESSIRVDVALLEKLMTRVGELVLARNQIMQFNDKISDAALLNATQRLNLITSELQESVMKTRMQPIGNIWSKFPRVIRDLASMCGKEVRLEMEGKETELDKTIIEAIKDPLTHLIRNSADHGIELPDVRITRGKPREGVIRLRAFHEGGQVIIEVTDDGAGLNAEKVCGKAIERGLISKEQAARMSEREISRLIFLPGFSTAERVTNVSGRGVGMDVVKTNIEKIGGTVDLVSQSGIGSTIRIKIPLTLAIVPALIVYCNGDRYAIPQVSLLELVRLDQSEASRKIEWIQDAPVHRLRGQLLPLVYLNDVLGVPRNASDASAAINIVVLRADDRQFGLVVDRIRDTEEIVVKPLTKQLKGITAYAGMTIMGDGRVALILDVMGLAHSAHVISVNRGTSVNDQTDRSWAKEERRRTLLVLESGKHHRFALPIDAVTRLEKFSAGSLEWAGHQQVVQYRGDILPLARISDALGLPSNSSQTDSLDVVVYSQNGNSLGLIVDRIVDIVECEITSGPKATWAGIAETAVIGERVTDILDLHALVAKCRPDFGTLQSCC